MLPGQWTRVTLEVEYGATSRSIIFIIYCVLPFAWPTYQLFRHEGKHKKTYSRKREGKKGGKQTENRVKIIEESPVNSILKQRERERKRKRRKTTHTHIHSTHSLSQYTLSSPSTRHTHHGRLIPPDVPAGAN